MENGWFWEVKATIACCCYALQLMGYLVTLLCAPSCWPHFSHVSRISFTIKCLGVVKCNREVLIKKKSKILHHQGFIHVKQVFFSACISTRDLWMTKRTTVHCAYCGTMVRELPLFCNPEVFQLSYISGALFLESWFIKSGLFPLQMILRFL